MDPKRWTLIEHLFEEAERMPEEERAAFLKEMSNDDKEIVAEIEALLAAKPDAVSFIEDFQEALFIKPVDAPATPEGIQESHPSPTDPLIGKQISQYKIQEKIGQGGMGVVYRATDTQLNREVALKLLQREMDTNEEIRRRFLVEARAASALTHPNVATIYSVQTHDDGRLVIAMMLCAGGSLKDHLKLNALSQEEAVDIALQIAHGLKEAHDNGIIHRDIKPGNILFSTSKNVRIADFGLARITDESRITHSSHAMGTLRYMSPEQVQGKANQQSDIWSLAAVLYEMLTGQTPFTYNKPADLLYALINEPIIPVEALRPDIPDKVAAAVGKALAKDIAKRYSRIDDFIRDLQDLETSQRIIRESSAPTAKFPTTQFFAPVSSVTPEIKNRGPLKILVVDDEPDVELLIQQNYYKKIRSGEWKLDFAENGEQALKRLTDDSSIQIILTDLHMPVMNGLTLLANLREHHQQVKTIVLSAYGDILNVRKAMNLGAFDFLFKPIEFDDLERTIYRTHQEVMYQEQVYKNQGRLIRLESEIDLTRRLQNAVVPKQLPTSDYVSAYAYLQPAHEVRSTFYDIFYLGDEHLAFFIGEVAGEGFPAAVLMATCRTLLKADSMRGFQPAVCMNTLNACINLDILEGHFITAFYGKLNLKTGEIVYCNAGHTTPFLLKQNNRAEQLGWQGGIGIGVKKNHTYEDYSFTMDAEDGLILFSKGLLKATNTEGQFYSIAHLEQILSKHADAAPSNAIKHIIRDISAFTEDAPQTHDLTLVALKRMKVG